MAFLEVKEIRKQEREFELKGISFGLNPSHKLAIAGETGSGKTTVLKIIGGYAQADSGQVFFEGKRVEGPWEKLLPGHPGIAYLSQHFELRNNYFVEEILSYANQLSDEEAAKIHELCDVRHLLKRRTDQLSGGEKQRIALARLLVGAPKLLLLDEPFSNLDPVHRRQIKTVLKNIGEQLKITTILVSHDPADALTWADEILILRKGSIAQKGSPFDVYHQPNDEYIAALLGDCNFISREEAKWFSGIPKPTADQEKLLIRPEHFKLKKTEKADKNTGRIKRISFAGFYYDIEIELNKLLITVKQPESEFSVGDPVSVRVEKAWWLPKSR